MIIEIFKTCLYQGKLYHLWSDGSLTFGVQHHVLYLGDAPKEILDWVYSQEATYKFNVTEMQWERVGFVNPGHNLYSVFKCTTGYEGLCVAEWKNRKTIVF